MKNLLQWMMAAIFVCGASVFTSCSDDKDSDIENLSEKIIGKWITADVNGKDTPTNEKSVLTFVSTTKAYKSASILSNTDWITRWIDKLESDVVINGNKVTLTNHSSENQMAIEEYIISDINDNEFTANKKTSVWVDGQKKAERESVVRFEKIKADYSEAILGMWEGHVTSEQGSAFDDGEDHKWEYKNDGNYVYYIQDEGGNWIANPGQTLSEYFVDGTLLCTRWVNGGIENREWWEIASIKDGVMKWTALRQKEDGSTYVATFEMKK